MYKIIYDKQTGSLRATVNPGQDLNQVMSNYTNVDFITVDKIIVDKIFNQRVNLQTRTLENYTNTVQEPV